MIEEWKHTKIDREYEDDDKDKKDGSGGVPRFPRLFQRSVGGIAQT